MFIVLLELVTGLSISSKGLTWSSWSTRASWPTRSSGTSRTSWSTRSPWTFCRLGWFSWFARFRSCRSTGSAGSTRPSRSSGSSRSPRGAGWLFCGRCRLGRNPWFWSCLSTWASGAAWSAWSTCFKILKHHAFNYI